MTESEFVNEFDQLIKHGWWFSVTPKNNKWTCVIFKLKPSGRWEAQESKQFKSILKGMVWVENYLTNKIEND
tara:strand:+ start:1293 stop:1508 length:216 start_codon:yes stop_codon:yes gene_type:complete